LRTSVRPTALKKVRKKSPIVFECDESMSPLSKGELQIQVQMKTFSKLTIIEAFPCWTGNCYSFYSRRYSSSLWFWANGHRSLNCGSQRREPSTTFQTEQDSWDKRYWCGKLSSDGVVQALPEEVFVLLWGVTSFACLSLPRLCEVKSNEKDFELIVPDWTLDSQLLNATTVGVVTAHNSLLIYSLETKAWMRRFDCQEQSLLYSAQIHLSSQRDILIAAGTVFNEIQVWTPSLDTPTTAPLAIEKRLVGHEGCVFSLRFNNSGTLLASCSDDRTIRVWNVDQGAFLAIGYAHVARVWDVQFLPSDGENSYLLSNSEDTTALLWEFSKSDPRLKVQERYEGHSGKHIWSQAINRDGTMAATGGNDGGINLWDIAGWQKRTATSSSEIFWNTMSPRIMVDGHERLDPIKGCKCIRGKLLLTTNSGYYQSKGFLTD